ncbi:ASKHA domain-containing protein [Methylotuvimicrobium sp. KM2]|uniref:ASKHA domain-containing protein n=1 Tax=Methylotuvimicrobium sp. KM2 TaxID=3133976 RepID=UPI0031010F85
MPKNLESIDQQKHHRLRVRTDDCDLELYLSGSSSVREALDHTEIRVRAACGGLGTCGACLIQVISGRFNPPTPAERQKLLPDQLAQGCRLACQLRPLSDGETYLAHPAPPSQWRSPDRYQWPTVVFSKVTDEVRKPYGIAVDLGTTHIRLSIWNRHTARLIGCRVGINPQVAHGADVLTRLDARRLDVQASRCLMTEGRKAILDGIRDILSRDFGEVAHVLAETGKISIVGNTVMLMLIGGGNDSDDLYRLENWHTAVEYRIDDIAAWRQDWRMPHADISIVQPLAGFVGSDLLADLLATGITEQPEPRLLADLGTNTEIALWDGTTAWVTSVPGGPAFEGVGMRNGLTAETGAIYRVRADGERWLISTIGDQPIRGYCASGFIDAIAVMLDKQVLKPSGRFTQSLQPSGTGYRLDANNAQSTIFGSDIDIFQRAKASTAAAMLQLLGFADLKPSDLQAVWICGSLGQHLDLHNAMRVGLLPRLPVDRFKRLANASLAGCEQLLLDRNANARLNAIISKTKAINLGGISSYEESFIDQLRLQPMA